MPTEYNGWKNYETWNIALWLGNDEGLVDLVNNFGKGVTYKFFATHYLNSICDGTPDGINWLNCSLDHDALNEFLQEATA
jgi:hypothetical protein